MGSGGGERGGGRGAGGEAAEGSKRNEEDNDRQYGCTDRPEEEHCKLYENIGHASMVMTWEKLWSETNISMQGPGNILLY